MTPRARKRNYCVGGGGSTGCAAVGLALLHGTGLEDRNHPRGKSNTPTKNCILRAKYRADCLISARCTCLSEVDQAGLGFVPNEECVMLRLKLRARAAGLFGACI